jgi:hypothetical protein
MRPGQERTYLAKPSLPQKVNGLQNPRVLRNNVSDAATQDRIAQLRKRGVQVSDVSESWDAERTCRGLALTPTHRVSIRRVSVR